MEINKIIEYLSSIVDYLESFTTDSIEKDNAISRLKETIFWLTYLNEVDYEE